MTRLFIVMARIAGAGAVAMAVLYLVLFIMRDGATPIVGMAMACSLIAATTLSWLLEWWLGYWRRKQYARQHQ